MKSKTWTALGLALIFGFTGCAGVKNTMRLSEKNSTWNPLHQLTKDQGEPDELATPVTMTAIWKDSVYEKPGSPATKGFGGRFFFYDEDSKAIKADGELIVYGFDDSVKNKTESVADKKFVFRSEEFQQHYSESGIGASYSVWLPWEKIGGFRKSITLIPMFRLADGTVLKSGQSINVLPGKTPKQANLKTSPSQPYRVLGSSPAVFNADHNLVASEQNESRVAQVAFEAEADSRIRSSTFRVTPNLSRRMAQATQAEQANPTQPARSESPTLSTTAQQGGDFRANSKAKEATKTDEIVQPTDKVLSPRRAAFGQPAPFDN